MYVCMVVDATVALVAWIICLYLLKRAESWKSGWTKQAHCERKLCIFLVSRLQNLRARLRSIRRWRHTRNNISVTQSVAEFRCYRKRWIFDSRHTVTSLATLISLKAEEVSLTACHMTCVVMAFSRCLAANMEENPQENSIQYWSDIFYEGNPRWT